jgi:hypothetical protein
MNLARKRGEVNQESTLLDRSISDNTDYSDPIANWYSVDISYTPIDYFSAMMIASEIGDITRFRRMIIEPRRHHVCSHDCANAIEEGI